MNNEINCTRLCIDKDFIFKGNIVISKNNDIIVKATVNEKFKAESNFNIQGITNTGEKISLLNCEILKKNVFYGKTYREDIEIWSSILLKNVHIYDIYELSNCQVKIRYKNLSSFASNNGNKVYSNQLDDIELTFHKADNNDLEVVLKFTENFNVINIHKYIFPINALLSISSNQYITPDEIIIESNKNKMKIIYGHVTKLNDKESVSNYNLSLLYKDIINKNEVLSKWNKIISKCPNVMGYMCSHLYENYLSQISVLKLLQALEVYSDEMHYCENLIQEKEKDIEDKNQNIKNLKEKISKTKLDTNLKDEIQQMIKVDRRKITSKDISYVQKVKDILDRTSYIHEIEDIETLASNLKKRRNKLTHCIYDYDTLNNFKNDRVYITEFIYTILRACILKDVGLNEDRIYNTWRQKQNMNTFKLELIKTK